MKPDPFLVAWAAGLFEGEGSITSVSSNGNLRLQLKMTDKDVMLKFAECVSGHITGPYCDGPKYKVYWSWTAGKPADVNEILTAFWPYLCERRRKRAQQDFGFVPDGPAGDQRTSVVTRTD